MTEVTNTRVELEHPYRIAGIISVLVSFVILGFTLGVLARCGGGRGICLDPTSHAAGDAGLLLFIVFFIVGIAMIVYSGSTGWMTTRTESPKPAAPAVTNVFPAAPASAPPVTNVYPQAPAAPATTVVVTPPP
jgi:hypothetical protein